MRNKDTLPAIILLTAISFGHAFTSGQPCAANTLVTLERVSIDRIETRQKSMANTLDSQSKSRTATIAIFSTTAGLALLGGGWYAYQQYIKPPTPPSMNPIDAAKKFEDLYYERRLAHFEETQTVKGLVKHGIRNGFGYAIATLATVTLLSSFNKMTNISLPSLRESLYPTTQDLCVTQEHLFKESFDYLQATLQDLATEQAMITTPEQLEIFGQWRSMLCTGMQTSIATLVKSVEDFSALSIELATRAHKTLAQDHPAIAGFSVLLRRVDTLIAAINGLSTILEATVNASDLTTLNRNRVQVGMHFKNTIVTAREALHHVVMLVDSI